MNFLIPASYFVAAVLFIIGIKRMSSPVTARGGIIWAGVGMLVATLVTFLVPGISFANYILMVLAVQLHAITRMVAAKHDAAARPTAAPGAPAAPAAVAT